MTFENARLTASGTATIAGGTATIVISPSIQGEQWDITKLVVSSTSVAQTEVRIYRGTASDVNLIDGSYSGNQDVSDTELTLLAGEVLTFQWTGGTNGATCTARLEGTRSFKRRR
jgi:hypothetical protein